MRGHFVVTGCAGLIGSHLTDGLLADGQAVVGIDSFEGAIHGEVLGSWQLVRLGRVADLREESLGDGRREQALAVPG